VAAGESLPKGVRDERHAMTVGMTRLWAPPEAATTHIFCFIAASVQLPESGLNQQSSGITPGGTGGLYGACGGPGGPGGPGDGGSGGGRGGGDGGIGGVGGGGTGGGASTIPTAMETEISPARADAASAPTASSIKSATVYTCAVLVGAIG
jgi:hypothetical protein